MNEQSNTSPGGVRNAIIDVLRSRAKQARFITELAASLARAAIGKEAMERMLAELEAEGLVMIRDHFCADPHLSDVDLRVVALVDEGAGGADAQSRAIHQIDSAWDKWLAEYLANHRCG
jgi:hypothetical protein